LSAKFFCCLSIVLVLSLLVGCTASPFYPSPLPITLRFAYERSAVDYKTLAEDFHQANPNITVELVPTRGQGFGGQTTFDADVVRWNAFYLNSETFPTLLKLDSWIETSSSSFQSDFVPGSFEALQIEGSQYGIPAGINPMVIFASPTRFKAANTPLPSPHWTLEDLVALGSAVNRQEGALSDPDYSIGFCPAQYGFAPMVITYLFGGGIFDQLPNPTRVTLDTPENINAVEWYASLRTRYGIMPNPELLPSNQGGIDLSVLLDVDKCALWMGFLDDLGNSPQVNNPEKRPIALPLPAGQASMGVVFMDSYFIMANSHNATAAWKWISFLLERPEAVGVMVPPLVSQINSTAFEKKAGADIAAVARSLPAHITVFSTSMGENSLLGTAFNLYNKAVNAVMAGEMDAATALEMAQKEANKSAGGP
jgi:ABC-type glycerol-3-phosphate transport system substrate-binding protein